MTRVAQGELVLWRIPLGRMKATDSMLVDIAHLANMYPVRHLVLDVLKKNAWTMDFHTIDNQKDNLYLMSISYSG